MILEEVYKYCSDFSDEEGSVLKELRRQTFLRTLQPHMLSGPLQGQFLKLLITLFKAKKVLEIGTFTGYATLCMADGLMDGGTIHTIELKEELMWFHDQFLKKSEFSESIVCHYGYANEVIPTLDDDFDFVFMDAGKKDYVEQIEMLIGKMKKGGVILADNVLWKAKILEPQEQQDKMTRMIYAFNEFVKNDPRLSNVILPIRDGLNLITVL